MSREIKIQNIERMIKQNEEKIEKLNFINSKLKRQKLELLRKKELNFRRQIVSDNRPISIRPPLIFLLVSEILRRPQIGRGGQRLKVIQGER
jgi:TolA-binding protein